MGTLPNAQRLPNAHRIITALQLLLMAGLCGISVGGSSQTCFVGIAPRLGATLCICMHR